MSGWQCSFGEKKGGRSQTLVHPPRLHKASEYRQSRSRAQGVPTCDARAGPNKGNRGTGRRGSAADTCVQTQKPDNFLFATVAKGCSPPRFATGPANRGAARRHRKQNPLPRSRHRWLGNHPTRTRTEFRAPPHRSTTYLFGVVNQKNLTKIFLIFMPIFLIFCPTPSCCRFVVSAGRLQGGFVFL